MENTLLTEKRIETLTRPNAKWIWPGIDKHEVNQYVEFRYTFEITDIEGTELLISSDSNFAAWINGDFVATGQFPDFPDKKTYSTVNIEKYLRAGNNVLAVLVYYCGLDHLSYIPDEPGLWFTVKTEDNVFVSNEEVLCRVCEDYTQGDMERISPQRGYTFAYDARNSDDWISPDYFANDQWTLAVEASRKCKPSERPLPLLELLPRAAHEIVAQGVLKRFAKPKQTVAEMMQHDFMSSRHPHELFQDTEILSDKIVSRPITIECESNSEQDGAYVIVDLGQQECGFIDLELNAAEGTIIDIAVGEHLADMRVRSSIYGHHNFAVRYIAKEGKQRFVHYIDRYSGRYVQLHITNISSPVTLDYAGLIPAEYPVEFRGKFNCSDSLLDKIYDVSGRTLHLCMHETYEDCPWREQALYAGDARTEALSCYYLFGDYKFTRVSLDLLKESVDSHGYVQLCAPSETYFTIPFFTMAWLISLAEYIKFSGDIEGLRSSVRVANTMVSLHCSKLVDNLLPCPKGRGYWHFYDWVPGLVNKIARTDEDALSTLRFNSILNFSFIFALNELAETARYYGRDVVAQRYKEQAEIMKKAAHDMFWREDQQCYVTYVGDDCVENHYCEMTQALAVLSGVADSGIKSILQERLACSENGLIATSLGMSIYKYDAILKGSAEAGNKALKSISSQWRTMLYNGATTFWETIKGYIDMKGAGSLCHGFSTTPVYVYQAYTLGIQPIEIGFSRFSVRPVWGDLFWASGKVPTPYGEIEIRWEKQGSSYVGSIIHPKGTEPVLIDSGKMCQWKIETR